VAYNIIFWLSKAVAGYFKITAVAWIICNDYTPNGVVVVVPVIIMAAAPQVAVQEVKYLLLIAIIYLQI
jgi:hypothetical protein